LFSRTRFFLKCASALKGHKYLKALETENAKLKKLLAERDLDIEVLKEVNRRKW
jgi:hypothetical protein